jgi:hypothetical protein
MTLPDWARAGLLRRDAPTRDRIARVFGVVDRDLADAARDLSPDGRFNLAYNAALQLCAIVLLAEGWRAEKVRAHYLTIAALPKILGPEWQDGADYLDACRAIRNGLDYDAAGRVGLREAKELRAFALELRGAVVAWLAVKHPGLAPGRA